MTVGEEKVTRLDGQAEDFDGNAVLDHVGVGVRDGDVGGEDGEAHAVEGGDVADGAVGDERAAIEGAEDLGMQVAEDGALAGGEIDVFDDGEARHGEAPEFGPPLLEVVAGVAADRRIGGADAAGDGVADGRGKAAGAAVEAGTGEALVFEAEPEVFDSVGDLAGIKSLQGLALRLTDGELGRHFLFIATVERDEARPHPAETGKAASCSRDIRAGRTNTGATGCRGRGGGPKLKHSRARERRVVLKSRDLPEVIVLAGQAGRTQEIRHALEPCKVKTTRVSSLEECRQRLAAGRPQLLVMDCVTAKLGWRQAWNAAQEAGVPMIAIVERFDSRGWVELFKAGVLDVMADPIPAHRLQMAVQDALYGEGGRESEVRSWAGRLINGVRGWLGL